MKIIVFLFLFCLAGSVTYSQSNSYVTTKIALWTLEKFPKKFLIKPFKVYTEKTKTGQLTYYQELNENGQADGLTVRIQKDYSSPHTIYYYRKGITVYRATYFNRSTKADEIVNKNLNDLQDGPQINRKIFIDNSLQEIIEEYKEGELISTNKPDNSPHIIWNKNSLLDGKFKFLDERSYMEYEGLAKEGMLIFLKETYMRKDVIENRILGDSVLRKGISGDEQGKKENYLIKSKYKITNSEELKYKDGYHYCESLIEIPNVLKKMRLFSLPSLEDTAFYKDSLLEGKYTIISKSFDSYEVYSGLASEGALETLFITYYKFDQETGISSLSKSIEFKLNSDSVFIKYINGEKISDDNFKIISSAKKITNSQTLINGNKNFKSLNDISYNMIYNMRYH